MGQNSNNFKLQCPVFSPPAHQPLNPQQTIHTLTQFKYSFPYKIVSYHQICLWEIITPSVFLWQFVDNYVSTYHIIVQLPIRFIQHQTVFFKRREHFILCTLSAQEDALATQQVFKC